MDGRRGQHATVHDAASATSKKLADPLARSRSFGDQIAAPVIGDVRSKPAGISAGKCRRAETFAAVAP
jgi:hypothetical protein